MHEFTTVEADPEGAASYLRVLKALEKENPQNQEKVNWISITLDEVRLAIHRDTLWSEKDINLRGHDYEKIRVANLGSNCPHIDDYVFVAMTVTSMKTLDLATRPYQNVRVIDSLVSGYIDKLSLCKEVHWNDGKNGIRYDLYRGQHFQDRYLEVAIPAGRATEAQIEKLEELQEFAMEKDVTFVVVEVP